MQGGAVSSVNVALIGLDNRLPEPANPDAVPPGNPCQALFGPDGWTADRVPVAIFSDFNCPYCKALDARLIALRDSGAPIRLVWHEMPLLGQGSYRSAKAVIAADYLGQGAAAREYLWHHNLRPGPAALGRMAETIDLLPDMLRREFDSGRVIRKLSTSLALGRKLGIPGAPGTVIGRTLVVGAISPPDLDQLIGLERDTGPLTCT